jgi:hypothetical protein
MSDLLDPTAWAGNVVVPSQGWFIFGGLGDANFTTAQKLGSVDGVWEVGPALLDNKKDHLQCIVQVKKRKMNINGFKKSLFLKDNDVTYVFAYC